MPDASPPARAGTTLGLALLAAALCAFATCRARTALVTPAAGDDTTWARAQARLETLPPLPSTLPGRPFWIGAWVGPPPAANDAATWRRYAAAGLDVTLVPLEDRYLRADNRARLAALDTLDVGVLAIVRDDAVHPDETTRPGWEARLDSAVAAYRGARSYAGLMLADEPRIESLGQWAPLARRLAAVDPGHPAYVNFAGLSDGDALDAAARARWEADLDRAIVESALPSFTFDVYPFVAAGEKANWLASITGAARVAQRTRRPFGAALQWTGHGPLHPATAAEASYLAMMSLAHGASSLVWFTYWTPNPDEEPWHWKGGAVEYDGRTSARHDTLAALNAVVRRAAAWRGPRAMLVVHEGGGLPHGFAAPRGRAVPGVARSEGGPRSIAFAAREEGGARRYLVVDRGRVPGNRVRLTFVEGIASADLVAFDAAGATRRFTAPPGRPLVVEFTLDPGSAAGILARPAPP